MMADDDAIKGLFSCFEVRITRVHVHPDLLLDGHKNRIDATKWKPLIMNFQKFFGLAPGETQPSRLADRRRHLSHA